MIAIIKSKFSFFQIQNKFLFRDSIELRKPSLGIAPERLNTINMSSSISELIVAMMHPVMFVISDIYQPVIPSPSIRMNNTLRTDFAPYNALKCLFTGIRDNLCVDFSLPLEYAKDNRFARSSPSSFAWDPSWAKVGFIDFNGSGKGSFLLAPTSNFNP